MKHITIIIKVLFTLFLSLPIWGGLGWGFAQTKFQIAIGGTDVDFGTDAKQTSDGGYIIVGRTASFGAGLFTPDIYLVKTDGSGILQWSRRFGGGGFEYDFFSVEQTTDGGYVIGGTTSSFGAGSSDGYIIKTDNNGDLLWSKTFGGVNGDYFTSVRQTTDGGYIAGGSTNSFGAGNGDVYLVKTDASGNLSWSKTFGGGSDEGWVGLPHKYEVKQTIDGGYVFVGTTGSFGAGNYDVYLIKTDGSGNLSWSKTFGGANFDYGYSVQQASDGGYIIAGKTDSYGAGGMDMYLIKTDGNGNLLWDATFGGTNADYALSVTITNDGGYIIVGATNIGSICLVKTDVSGNLTWSRTFGAGSGNSVKQTSDGGYIIVGSTMSFGAGGNDLYLIKTD